mgnify:CR=1 FL=1
METAEANPPATTVTRREIADLPCPRGIPVLGNALQLDPPRLHRQLEGWAREFGPFYHLKLGKRDFVVVADHTAIASSRRSEFQPVRSSFTESSVTMQRFHDCEKRMSD